MEDITPFVAPGDLTWQGTVLLVIVTSIVAGSMLVCLLVWAYSRKRGLIRDWMKEHAPRFVPRLTLDQDIEVALAGDGGEGQSSHES